MSDPQAGLRDLQPKHEYLIAIDSDGCAFDTMDLKHKECFIPSIVKYWHLQPLSKYVRAAAEFVNLYSKWRGINRFPALLMVFDLLEDWPEVQKRDIEIPQVQSLRDWVAGETKLGNSVLKAEVSASGDPILSQALDWSKAVNKTVADIVHHIPPFPFVRESLEKLSHWADIIVCSATHFKALKREWEEHNLAGYTRLMAGQEMGSKKEHIHIASQGKYKSENVLMIGDAPGDMKAARGNNAWFFPVNPGEEDKSWEYFFNEAADKFKNGDYTKEYEEYLVVKFEKILPDTPPWKA